MNNRDEKDAGVSKEKAEKIDKTLDDLGVSKSQSGDDQKGQPDKEGSDSSSRDRDQK